MTCHLRSLVGDGLRSPPTNAFPQMQRRKAIVNVSLFLWEMFCQVPLFLPVQTFTARTLSDSYTVGNHPYYLRILLVRKKFPSEIFLARTAAFETASQEYASSTTTILTSSSQPLSNLHIIIR